jgi:hypothetical protein
MFPVPVPRFLTRAALAVVTATVMAAAADRSLAAGPAMGEVDTALLLAVDVSSSVDDERYRLQMEGIAAALEDPGVIRAITNGPQAAILFSIATWADRTDVALPWVRIASAGEARAVAAEVRALPRFRGTFTCVAQMLRIAADKIVPQIPARANRIVIDVSGDGREDCNPDEPPAAVRDELVEAGVTVNGLPIVTGGEGDTIEAWYEEHVKGGPGSFVMPADGYRDFERAIRQKFIVEISGLPARWPARRDVAGGE